MIDYLGNGFLSQGKQEHSLFVSVCLGGAEGSLRFDILIFTRSTSPSFLTSQPDKVRHKIPESRDFALFT